MPRFSGFNTENKLRIPLSTFAAHTIENDQHSFSIKKTTLINTIIMNFYQRAECTISLRLREYKDELTNCFHGTRLAQSAPTIDTIVSAKAIMDCASMLKCLAEKTNDAITRSDLLTARNLVRWIYLLRMEESEFSREMFAHVLSLISEEDSVFKVQWDYILTDLYRYFENIESLHL